jgi:hypothetical protein
MAQEPKMKSTSHINMTKSAVCRFSISLLAVAGLAAAQDQAPHGWRSVNDPLPAGLDQAPGQPDQSPNINAQPELAQAGNPQAGNPQGNQGQFNQGQNNQGQNNQGQNNQGQNNQGQYNQGQYNQAPPYNGPGAADPRNYPPQNDNYGVPPRLTIKPGTYVSVRMNQWLSSDRNQQGDTFTATLSQPLVVDGLVVAQRGQTVYGRVSEAQKAGRVEGTSRLAVQLTQLSLVDGQQAPIQSQMINRTGPTSQGRDAAAIGGTTALGAIIGAGVDGGRGAGIGAGAGAAAGILGVLLTRGRPTVIYPESILTFQIQAPVEISTDRSPQAFQYVNAQQDYGRGQAMSANRAPAGNCYDCGAGAPPPPAYGYAPAYAPGYYPPYAYGYGYGYGYPYYGGFSLFVGPRYGYGFGGRGFYGGGFRGGRR